MARPKSVTREVPVLFPSDPAQRPLPNPIPASLYARPPGASQAEARNRLTAALRRWASDFRGWPVWKQLLTAIASMVGFLIVTILTLTVPGSLSTSRQHSSRPTSPLRHTAAPSRAAVTPPRTPATIPAVAAPPTPTTIPVVAAPVTPRPTAPPVSFLNAPLSAQQRQTVTLSVKTAPNTACSIDVGYPSETELDSAMSDGAGNLSWTWRVGNRVPPGTWPITVSCRTGTASTSITVS